MNWKELGEYINTLTEEEKRGDVTIVDYASRSIGLVSTAEIQDETMYSSDMGLTLESELEAYSENDRDTFEDEIYEVAVKGSVVLVID